MMPDFNPWGHSKRNPPFYPSPSLSSIISPALQLQTVEAPLFSSLPPLSTPMEF
jgi:hypothetical protein